MADVRWSRACLVALATGLAVILAPRGGVADETLTLQGPAPRLTFDDDAGTLQMWDLFGDHTGFDVIDSTAGTSPFHIDPGAVNNSVVIGSTGNVGLGIVNPAVLLHVNKTAQAGTAETLARFAISDDAIGRLSISNNSSSNGIFHPRIQGLATSQATALSLEGIIGTDAGVNPAISFNAARSAGGGLTARPLVVFRNNSTIRAQISASGDMTATSFSPVSTRAAKEAIEVLATVKALAALRELTPVEFVYKDDELREKRVGFIAEDVPEIVANPDRKSVPIMDVLAVVTQVVKDQQQVITGQQRTTASQRRQLTAQRKHLERQQQQIEKQQDTIDQLVRRLEQLERKLDAPRD